MQPSKIALGRHTGRLQVQDSLRAYRPADARFQGCYDGLVSRQHRLVDHSLILTEMPIGGYRACDVGVIGIILAPHVQQ